MFHTPASGVGNGSKFLIDIAASAALTAGSCIADWLASILPSK